MSDLITRTQTAALAGVSADTLARWHAKEGNDFPRPVAWVSDRKLYSKAEVLSWLDARTKRKPRSTARGADAHAEA